LGNSLEKWWPSEVATLGTVPEAKWPKIHFLSVFLRKHPGKMVAMRVSKVATSHGHNFSSEFPQKINLWPCVSGSQVATSNDNYLPDKISYSIDEITHLMKSFSRQTIKSFF
jgi:hypothetical protein